MQRFKTWEMRGKDEQSKGSAVSFHVIHRLDRPVKTSEAICVLDDSAKPLYRNWVRDKAGHT